VQGLPQDSGITVLLKLVGTQLCEKTEFEGYKKRNNPTKVSCKNFLIMCSYW
jgi:hypothetical protein